MTTFVLISPICRHPYCSVESRNSRSTAKYAVSRLDRQSNIHCRLGRQHMLSTRSIAQVETIGITPVTCFFKKNNEENLRYENDKRWEFWEHVQYVALKSFVVVIFLNLPARVFLFYIQIILFYLTMIVI